jgi:serine/threonine protein kinase
MARLIFPKHWEGYANDGERRVIEYLAKNLPLRGEVLRDFDKWGAYGEEYIVIPNFTLSRPGGLSLEVDGVVIAPHAVYLIETKDWRGRIEGDDQEWLLDGTKERENPNHSINNKAKRLSGDVSQRKSYDIKNNVCFTHVVVIADLQTELLLSGDCAKTTFQCNDKLLQYLMDYSRVRSPNRKIRIQKNGIHSYQLEIAEFISSQKGVKQGPKIINGYEVIEELMSSDDSIEYLARLHNRLAAQSSVKRLRVFRLPLHLPKPELERKKSQQLRDYAALDLIGNHPNIVALRGEPMEYHSDKLVEVLDWSEEGTLRTVMKQGTLSLEQIISIIEGIAKGLQAAHELSRHGKSFREIIHRDLRPENILIRQQVPQIMNWDKAYLYVEGQEHETFYLEETQRPRDERYLPPELVKQDYDTLPCSDLYSLGVIFYELLTGEVPYDSPAALKEAGGSIPEIRLPSKRVPGIPEWVDQLIQQLYVSDEDKRIQSASEFLQALEQARLGGQSQASQPNSPPVPEPVIEDLDHTPNRVFQPGERVNDYRVLTLISQGAFAQVYQVVHMHREQEYALKVYNDSVPLNYLQDEFNILYELEHAHIVEVEWSGQIQGGRHWIVMEFLNGEPLSNYAWNKSSSKKLPLHHVLEAGLQMTSALRYLHEGELKIGKLQGHIIYHRDIKPNNIMWVPDRGFVLIDFNIGIDRTENQARTKVGTTPYVPPDRVRAREIDWDASCDTYALGVTLYELVSKQHPYLDKDPELDSEPIDPRTLEISQQLAPAFAEFLIKAVQPKLEKRFQTASEMEAALLAFKDSPLYWSNEQPEKKPQLILRPDELQRANYNPYVSRLRTLFSQAKISNAGTRGLDEMARETYIQTRLDRELVPAILDGQFKLVIITGNAGDGKTALIQQLERRLEERQQNVERLSSGNGSRFTIRGIGFETNYDGSQDEGELSNDEVLEKFLAPFARVKELSRVNTGRILAINEGRLVEFLADVGRRKQFGFLYDQVDRYFNERASHELPDHMIMVNLNWRSVVSREQGLSLLEAQLEELLKPELWQACTRCDYQSQCMIRYNVLSMGDPAAGAEIRNRLAELVEGVQLRRELHITMRDLRSLLSWLIVRDQDCDDVARQLSEMQDNASRLNYLGQAYWNLTDPEELTGGQDRLVERLHHLDIGQVPEPGMDRDLHFSDLDQFPWLEMEKRRDDVSLKLLTTISKDLPSMAVHEQEVNLQRRVHRLMVRKQYYEGRQKALQRLPYQYLDEFKAVLAGSSSAMQKAQDMLIYGISRSEGCRNDTLARKAICLAATTGRDPRYASYRLFDQDLFEIDIPKLGNLAHFLENMPDRFVLRHRNALHSVVALEVSLDLFELMNHIARGFTPSMNDLHGHFIELIIFKNALRNLPYRSVMVTQDHQEFYRIEATPEQHLILEKA